MKEEKNPLLVFVVANEIRKLQTLRVGWQKHLKHQRNTSRRTRWREKQVELLVCVCCFMFE